MGTFLSYQESPGTLVERTRTERRGRVKSPLQNPPTLLMGMYVGAATVENSIEVP